MSVRCEGPWLQLEHGYSPATGSLEVVSCKNEGVLQTRAFTMQLSSAARNISRYPIVSIRDYLKLAETLARSLARDAFFIVNEKER